MADRPPAGSGPILVTGAPFSGTTWFGRTLSSIGALPYVHEPFNKKNHLYGYDLRFESHFTYITEKNEAKYLDQCRRLGSLRPRIDARNLWRNFNLFRCEFNEWRVRLHDRLRGGRAIWKDPLAVLSAGWIARRFDASVILLMRHPAGFTEAALKRSKGRSGLSGVDAMLHQPIFMDRHGDRYSEMLESMHSGRLAPHVEKACLWRVLLEVAALESEGIGDRYSLVRYEDACERPVDLFTTLVGSLGIAPRRGVAGIVEGSMRNHAHRRRRAEAFDMANSLYGWRRRFSKTEISEIVDAAGPIAREVFGDGVPKGVADPAARAIDVDGLRRAIADERWDSKGREARSA